MAGQLGGMVEEVNAVRGRDAGTVVGEEEGGAVSKIVKILDTHLTSLQWLDARAEELAARVTEVRVKGERASVEAEMVHLRSVAGGRCYLCFVEFVGCTAFG
ncbi:hypothetical protein BC830DRAFT_1146037 [Chytriomyces sp. MP71]|nr:hypothetical protein BC830DRAFT_1146037 [Chytriomyces sp. MP71]